VLASLSGIGTGDATRLAEGVRKGRALGSFGERVSVEDVRAGVQISAAQAEAERKTLGTVRKDEALNRKLIEQSARMEDVLIDLSDNATKITNVADMIVNTMETIVHVEKKVTSAIDEIKRRL
jgi:hypothetical protein